MFKRALLVTAAAFVVACAATTPPPRFSGADPSDPRAPEAPYGAPTALATPAPAVVVYACPMHPDQKATAPGTCPTCGMAFEALPHRHKQKEKDR